MKYVVKMSGEEVELSVDKAEEGMAVSMDGLVTRADLVRVGASPVYSLILGGRSYEISVHSRNGAYEVVLGGETYVARVLDERAVLLASVSEGGDDGQTGEAITAPMPGIVVGVAVSVGDEVAPGQGVVTLEAMKMENELKAAAGGVVTEVRVQPGQGVAQGEALIIIE